MADPSDHAAVIAPPPLIYLGALVIGLIVNYLLPISFLPQNVIWIAGIPLITVGFGIGALAVAAMYRAGTSPDPWEPTKCIVTDGPFRFTRNPIYISFALIYLGVTCAMNSFAALALLPLVLVVIARGVIAPEERYLERKFGEEYLSYKQRVRRWI